MNKRYFTYLVVLLLAGGSKIACAQEGVVDPTTGQSNSKQAKKTMMVLGAIGLDTPEIVGFVKEIDKRVKDKYLRISEDRIMDGTLTMHYELSGGVTGKQLELKYAPDDSFMTYTARTNGVMANYNFKF